MSNERAPYVSDEQIREMLRRWLDEFPEEGPECDDPAIQVRDLYEAHLKEKDELLRAAAILLKRSKVGTAFARKFENMTNPAKPSTIGVEYDKDSDALLALINSRLNPEQ